MKSNSFEIKKILRIAMTSAWLLSSTSMSFVSECMAYEEQEEQEDFDSLILILDGVDFDDDSRRRLVEHIKSYRKDYSGDSKFYVTYNQEDGMIFYHNGTRYLTTTLRENSPPQIMSSEPVNKGDQYIESLRYKNLQDYKREKIQELENKRLKIPESEYFIQMKKLTGYTPHSRSTLSDKPSDNSQTSWSGQGNNSKDDQKSDKSKSKSGKSNSTKGQQTQFNEDASNSKANKTRSRLTDGTVKSKFGTGFKGKDIKSKVKGKVSSNTAVSSVIDDANQELGS